MTEPEGAKARHKTTNWAPYNAALKSRGSLTIWLDENMGWYASTSGKRGRHRFFSDATIHFSLSIKCLFGLAMRQSMGLDAALLPELLSQIPRDKRWSGVNGTMACHVAIVQRGARAVIPPRKNAQPWKATQKGAQARNEALKACYGLGRGTSKKWSRYYRRSLVETNYFKRLVSGSWHSSVWGHLTLASDLCNKPTWHTRSSHG